MHEMDHSMHMGNFKQKFWLSFILAIPIIVLSPMMGMELPFQFSFPGSEWVVLVLATILFFYGGQPFLSGAKMEIKQKNPAMMTLISLGITVSYVYSLYSFIATNFFHQHVMDFFWELASLIVIMLLGHWIEMNAVSNASNALQKLAELLPDEVTKLHADGQEERLSLQAIHEGDTLVVRAGDKMPTDGRILKGQTIVDESAVTGESKGVKKTIGDRVIGGSVNGDGTIHIQVTGTGENGYLAQVMEMVRKAQSEKSQLEALSDKVVILYCCNSWRACLCDLVDPYRFTYGVRTHGDGLDYCLSACVRFSYSFGGCPLYFDCCKKWFIVKKSECT
jgi:Cu2+-exporting ATPase